ncbi:MAG TPA: response regulator [Terriglobia bacterium]|nr:response regulator [Terriglobia bacterium]
MEGKAFALVVHDRPEPCQELKLVLRCLGVDTFSVRTQAEAVLLLEQTHPHLIFTDVQLPDGTWTDLINVADSATVPTCVVLVGPSNDPDVFQSAQNHGAFDFISPPFDCEIISRLLDEALALVRSRRDHNSRAVA